MARKAIDLHCDTLMKVAKSGNLDENEKSHVTLRGLQEGGVALQCFADFVPTGIFPKPIRKAAVGMMFNKFYKNYQKMMAFRLKKQQTSIFGWEIQCLTLQRMICLEIGNMII